MERNSRNTCVCRYGPKENMGRKARRRERERERGVIDLFFILFYRFLWDGCVLKGRKISTLDDSTEIFQYVTSSMTPLSDRDHCILRSATNNIVKKRNI